MFLFLTTNTSIINILIINIYLRILNHSVLLLKLTIILFLRLVLGLNLCLLKIGLLNLYFKIFIKLVIMIIILLLTRLSISIIKRVLHLL